MSKKKILAISGSTKSRSTCLSIIKFIGSQFVENMDLSIYNDIDQLPHFNPELDNETPPQEVVAFRNLIEEADGVLFCTPEYVFSLPGSLKNAIEWTVSTTLFSNKPVAMIVAAALGRNAFESLSKIMTTIEAVIPDDSKLLIGGAKGKVSGDGKVTDKLTQEAINMTVESLLETVESDDKIPTKYLKH